MRWSESLIEDTVQQLLQYNVGYVAYICIKIPEEISLETGCHLKDLSDENHSAENAEHIPQTS